MSEFQPGDQVVIVLPPVYDTKRPNDSLTNEHRDWAKMIWFVGFNLIGHEDDLVLHAKPDTTSHGYYVNKDCVERYDPEKSEQAAVESIMRREQA